MILERSAPCNCKEPVIKLEGVFLNFDLLIQNGEERGQDYKKGCVPEGLKADDKYSPSNRLRCILNCLTIEP